MASHILFRNPPPRFPKLHLVLRAVPEALAIAWRYLFVDHAHRRRQP